MTAEPVSTKKVIAVVSFYVITSIAMIMINKTILKKTTLPLFFLWAQLVFAALVLRLSTRFTFIPELSMGLAKDLAPLIVINVIGLTMNTLCLANLDATLYQITRSLVLPITVALSPFMGTGGVGVRVVGACTIIFCGFLIGIFGDNVRSSNSSASMAPLLGITFGVLSSMTTAVHSFIIKSSVNTYKAKGPFDLVYLNNALSAICLMPILLFEITKWPQFISNTAEMKAFLIGTVVAGGTGLLINVAGFLQIKVTSPLTHTVASAARGVLQSIAAWVCLGEVITVARSIGIVVTLGGSCLYSWIKMDEARQESAKKPAPPV